MGKAATVALWYNILTWCLASVSSKAVGTETEETIPLVLAGSSVLTHVRLAVINS